MKQLLAILLILWAAASGAVDESTTFVYVPVRPMLTSTLSFSAGSMRCTKWVANPGITNATRIAWEMTAGMGGGGLCAVAVYNADGSTQLATTGAKDCSATGHVEASGLTPFSLVTGTAYQVCECASASAGSMAASDPGSGTPNLTDFQNALSVPERATAANGCTAAVPPATTGALTASNANAVVVLLGTNAP